MKRVRMLCLFVIAAVCAANPSLLVADGTCCSAFINHCNSFCGSHGGVQTTNCGGLGCSDTCWCNGVDPETSQHYNDYHEGGYCSSGGCEGEG